MTIHWTDADARDVERWAEERVERAGGPLFFHAEWAARDAAWAAKVREVCTARPVPATTNPEDE